VCQAFEGALRGAFKRHGPAGDEERRGLFDDAKEFGDR
jgi:hypothetical protein